MNTLKEGEWKGLKGAYVKREGWFVPTLVIKYAQTGTTRDMLLKELCSRWLLENFNIATEIEDPEVLEREEIDTTLGLIGIRFSFSSGDGLVGESVAYVDVEAVEDIF